tara:strand:+ start:260 stop:1099 length:840 start_codon:yes stop_codon:yes gene_type:complete
VELGKYNTLTIVRHTSVGFFLEDENGDDVLLPVKWVPEGAKEGDEVEVFIYLDSEERPIATTMKPKAIVGEFAYLKAKQVSRIGAFMDWGLEKDLFVPFIEQEGRMQEGQWYIVYVYIDKMTDRIAGSAKIENFVEKRDIMLKPDQAVSLLIGKQTPLGYNVIVDNQYLGLIYENEIFKNVSTGDRTTGYVKNIREDDKIDIILQKPGYAAVEPNAQRILEILKANDGYLDLNDKSDPDEISRRLEMSKKTFKKAIGGLFRQKLITIEDDGVRLVRSFS